MTVERRRKIIKWTIQGIIVSFILIQLIPINRQSLPVRNEPAWDSQKTRQYSARACFDCHSNQTKWPGYSYIAPVSWFIANHVYGGRKRVNFSEWRYSEKKARKIIEDIREGDMPLGSYLILHPEARLTEAEKQEFISGLEKTLNIKKVKQQ
ncbi:MAG: heme-binding domain-containing protein [Methanococcaceae archaeon]